MKPPAPTGLKLLAAANFALAALYVFAVLGAVALLEGVAVQFLAGLGFACAMLLAVSGVGYLRRHSLLGRMLGNAYGAVGALNAIASALLMPEWAGGGLRATTLVGLGYPVLTLFLLNVKYKTAWRNEGNEAPGTCAR